MQVAAAHPGVADAEPAQELVDRAAAAERALERIGGVVVRLDQHRAQERVEIGAGLRLPRVRAQRLHGDRDLQRRGGRKARPRVPGGAATRDEILGIDAGRARERTRELPYGRAERLVTRGPHRARRRRARQADHVLDAGGPRPPSGRIGRRRGSSSRAAAASTEKSKLAPETVRATSVLSPARTTTAHFPLGSRPAIRPNETSRSARARRAAAAGAAGRRRSHAQS